MSFLQTAFDHIIPDAEQPDYWYVVLVSEWQEYGGPEEGGWWQTMHHLESYKLFPNKELADKTAEQIKEFAAELDKVSRDNYGQYCLNQMDWLEQRGLDADYLTENDGPTTHEVLVLQELPVYNNTRMFYS